MHLFRLQILIFLFGEVISSSKNEHPKIEKDKIIIKNILFIIFIFKTPYINKPF